MKLNKVSIFLTTIFLSQSSVAAIKTYENTWFEIEVILFSQLGDKSRLKEIFPDSSSLPNYPKVIDLLGPYLQPNIISLKQQLPSCQKNEQGEYPLTLINQAAALPLLFVQKDLTEIESVVEENTNNEMSTDEGFNGAVDKGIVDSIDDSVGGSLNESLDAEDQTLADSTRLQEQYILNSFQVETDTKQTEESSNNVTSIDAQATYLEGFEQSLSIPLTPEQLALVAQAEKNFSPIQFDYSPQPFAKELCAIDKSFFDNYKQTNLSFSYTGYPVDNIGLTLDGAEDYTATQPYLISKDSLKLKNIVRQLRRSRDFKPMLHLGWRQLTKLKKFAIPVHLFAGDNLKVHYQKSLKLYQQQLDESQQQEQTLNNILFSDQQIVELTAEEQAIQERINLIIKQADLDDKELAKVLTELDNSALKLKSNDSLMLADKPLPPVQSWSIDGFLKVEVERYLHITADFNVVNSSLAEQATKRLQPGNDLTVKSIRFQQNKRVRSNEIHYFDHPYMGMIVQIRRHKQLEPGLEEESEISEPSE